MVIQSTTAPSSGAGVAAPDLLLGTALVAARLADRSVRATLRVLSAVPGGRQLLAPVAVARRWSVADDVLLRVAEEGRRQRALFMAGLDRELRAQLPRIVDAVLDQLDLTEIVKERVDLDAVVREVDVDAVAARIDIDALIARLDLIGLARSVIEGVDLPEIVRDSTGSMASEGVRTVRMQTIDADERVNRLVDRLLLRHQGRRTAAPAAPEAKSPDDGGELP